jgi:hypothetical protein
MKNMKSFILVMMVVLVAACSPDKKTLAEASVVPDPDSNFEAVDSPLYFQLGTRWEMDGDGVYEIAKACEIPRLAPRGTIISCPISVPEAKLFYSNLKFLVGTTMSAVCPILNFSAYYYRRSNAVDFNPAGQDKDIDCSATAKDDNPICYGGAAPSMFTDFPETNGRYFNTNLLSQATYMLPSENSIRWYGGNSVSYLASNVITDPTSTLGGNVAAARQGEWHDYAVECTDMWNETLYKIDIYIQDENYDPATGGMDHFKDWP